MAETLPPEQVDRPDERGDDFRIQLGLSEGSYSQAIDESIRHALAPRPAGPAQPTWFSVGPRNVAGRVTALAQDPTNPLILYAGTAHGGLWRTIDAGDTWEHLDPPPGQADSGAHNVPVGTIAIFVDRTGVTTLYVGTGSLVASYPGGRGVYRVTIAGPRAVPRFERMMAPDPPTTAPADAIRGASHRYARIEIDPEDPRQCWLASQTGLWRWKLALGTPVASPPSPAPFTRDFPPSPAVAGLPTLATGPVPPPGEFLAWPAFATDVMVAVDPRETATITDDDGATRHRFLVVYVAIDRRGVFRGRFDRQTNGVESWTPMSIGFPAGFERVRVALCRSQPNHVYAVASIFDAPSGSTNPTNVFYSSNSGDSWRQQGIVPVDAWGQADYNLVLEVNPENPAVVICHVLDSAKSEDFGATFTPTADWHFDNVGDHAQHADNHAALFDAFERRRLWVGNDGGLMQARDLRQIVAPAPLRYWRKRSYGIVAGQFQDVAVHPALPNMVGGGLQDNGSWWGTGGTAWRRVGFADGGGFVFHRGSTRQMFPAQNSRFNMATVTPAGNAPYVLPLTAIVEPVVPELTAPVGGGVFAGTMETRIRAILLPASTLPWPNDFGFEAPFVTALAEDPTRPGQLLLGAQFWPVIPQALAYWQPPPPPGAYPAAPAPAPALPARVAVNIAPASLPPNGAQCSAVAIGALIAGQPLDAWLGTSTGQVYVATNPAAPIVPPGAIFNPTTPLPSPNGVNQLVTRVMPHPSDPRIVAVAAVPNPLRVTITIVAAGAPGAATFQFGVGALPPAGPPINTGANVLINAVNPPLTLTFAGGNFVGGDTWSVAADGTVTPTGNGGAANTSVGTIIATTPFGRTITVRITTAGQTGGPGVVAPPPIAQFQYQFAGSPAVVGQVTAPRFPVPGTLTTVFFSGNYALNDTWFVRPTGVVDTMVGASPLSAVAWSGGRVFLSYDRGATWADITAPLPPPARPLIDLDSLPPGPVSSLAFDPVDGRSLYAGTIAGVYIHRNLPIPTAIVVAPHPAGAPGLAVPAGHTRQLVANVTLSTGGPAVDWTQQVDWVSSNPAMPISATGVIDTAAAPAGAATNVTARRGTVVSPMVVVTVAPAAGAAPPLPPLAAFAAPNVQVSWRPFNNGLPLTVVKDIEVVPRSRRLRIATFGRGIYDCDLTVGAPPAGVTTTPPVRLVIRQTVIEDGTLYPRQLPIAGAAPLGLGGANWALSLNDDPRLPTGALGLTFGHAHDIRVDAPPFSFFDEHADGVEMEERIGVDSLIPLVRNTVYVQVQNSGFTATTDVMVHLFFMAAGAAVPTAPVAVAQPPLPGLALGPVADFYRPTANPATNFAAPAPAAQWQRVAAPVGPLRVGPGEPAVARFDWVVPGGLGINVALLALADSFGSDHVWPVAPADVEALVQSERRTALRVVPVAPPPAPAIYIRDGIDDGGVANGAVRVASRSPDIIVVQQVQAAPAPAVAFRDLLDPRPQDFVRAGVANQIYVRVHNRGLVATTVEVELWSVVIGPDNTPSHAPGNWSQIQLAPPASITVPVGPGTPAIAGPVAWTPNPADNASAYLLVALVKTTDNADPLPARARITTFADFWAFFQRFVDAENAAARALRLVP